ncbi:hypothetical protein, partial [Klebsiella pneumoniae]|uniref:hypothetical protein n=1 Tax=Klebsiella pneumoniae TaxID=573 RepID=UPI001CF0B100
MESQIWVVSTLLISIVLIVPGNVFMRSSTRRALCCFLLCRLCRTERRKNTTASSAMALQAH